MAKTLLEKFVLRRAAIYATPGAPTDTLKRVYGALTDGELGVVPATEIQRWNGSTNVFQIADHPIHTDAPTVYADDVLVSSGYTASASNNFEAQGAVATLSFTTDRTGQRISVKCKGALNAAATLIDNLAEIIYDLLVTTHGLTWEWDAARYSQAKADCAALGYLGGGVILDDGDPVTIADGILQPVGTAFAGGDGLVKLFVETLPTLLIPDEQYQAHEGVVTLRRTREAIVNDVQLEHRFNWRKRAFASLEKHHDGYATDSDAQSITEYKTRTQALSAPWLRTAAAATAAIDTLLALRARPRWDVVFQAHNFKPLHHQQGDLVAITGRAQLPGGAGVGEPWDRRLVRVRQVGIGFASGSCTLTGYDLETNWWIVAYIADGTYKATPVIKAGGNAVAA